jgi:hypothetical protein
MEKATFALPTVGSDVMSKDDQGALIVNQATAVIVSAWLAHATALIQTDAGRFAGPWSVDAAELATLIDSVQDALKSF